MPVRKFDCRPSCLFGSWFIDSETLESMEKRAISIIESGSLEAVAKETRDQVDQQKQNPYSVDNNGIATFSVTGPLTKYPSSFQSALGGSSYLLIQHALTQAMADPDVKAGMMIMDSPGGTVLGCAECVKAIQKFSAKKPMHIHAQGQATSAAYWLAIQGNLLSADPTAILGSVGAMSVLTDRSKQLANMGVEKIYVTNPGADKKGIGADGQKVTEAHRKEVASMLGDLAEPFIADVQARRDLPDSVIDEVKRAGVYVGKKGFEIGLVDAIGYTDDAYSYLRSKMPGATTGRDEGSGFTLNDDATKRIEPMPVTAEQLAKIQKINGLDKATADDAVDKLMVAFDANVASLAASAKTADDLGKKVTGLEADLATAKAAPAATKMSDREKELHGRIAKSSRETAIKTGAITPACADKVQAALGDNPELHATVFEAMATNTPTPKPGEQSPAQVVNDPNRQVDVAAAGTAEAKAYQDSQLQSRGLKTA